MQAFDDLLLLKRGGYATYVGHLGTHSVSLINYFQVSLPLYSVSKLAGCAIKQQEP